MATLLELRGCAEVLFETLDVARTRYWHDPWFLRQQPGKSDLSRSGVLAFRTVLERLNGSYVRLSRFGAKAWTVLAGGNPEAVVIVYTAVA